MPAPSPLAIASSSLQRLVKEEHSYHKELEQQEARLQKLEQEKATSSDENVEYQIRQEKQAIEETKGVFGQLRKKISDATARLESELEAEAGKGQDSNVEEITKAKETVAEAKQAYRELMDGA
ncbi:MAG: hypothetical protein M1833_003016 [Piccolia ochrophora]|nr:MAG: hypothetical protein M1833_003016 [Piccolia ochrophora]